MRISCNLVLIVVAIALVGCGDSGTSSAGGGAMPPPSDPKGQLLYAVQNGDVRTVSEFVGQNPDLISSTDADGATLLHVAAEADSAEVAEYLLDQGADVNARDADDETPLGLMVRRRMRNSKTFDLLKDRGGIE